MDIAKCSKARPQWRGEYVAPRSKPDYVSWYVLRRYVLPHVFGLDFNELPPTGTLDKTHLEHFRAEVAALSRSGKLKTHGVFFFYPVKEEYLLSLKGAEWLPERPQLQQVANEYGIKIIDIAQAKEWNETLYRDDGVHPSVQGYIVLSGILTKAVKESIGK